MRSALSLALAFASLSLAAPQAASQTVDPANLYTATDKASVEKARQTALTRSPTSNVKGKSFDRFVVIWNENTDYDKAVGDPNLTWLAKKGITLSNNNAQTHPSEPNYCASMGGDYFGMNNDDFWQIPKNVSTVVDLLESKGISWAVYQEDMPYSGYEGFQWVNQVNGANDYVRKHNPAVLYNSNAGSLSRLAQMKSLTQFHDDLEADKLPQWMFITPNMSSDGHDSSITVAGTWTRNFLEPLLNDKKFMKNTLVLITFDENHTYTVQNRILGILLGDAVPANLVGTTDDSYYNHYSEIATVEANWDLPTLGRWDVGANVYSLVAAKTGDQVRQWSGTPEFHDVFFNYSYSGPLNDIKATNVWAPPNVDACHAGREVAPWIKETWKGVPGTYYTDKLEVADGYHAPKGFQVPS